MNAKISGKRYDEKKRTLNNLKVSPTRYSLNINRKIVIIK